MTRRTAALHPVAVLSRWTGFCLPCASDERPLVLTWTGLSGLRGWLGGASFTDGELRLTCACCGGVDVVGWEDEPDPIVVPVAEEPAAEPVTVVLPEPVVHVVRVLDRAPGPLALQAVAAVPAPRQPNRAERRAARRTPHGVVDRDALDLLGLAG